MSPYNNRPEPSEDRFSAKIISMSRRVCDAAEPKVRLSVSAELCTGMITETTGIGNFLR